MWGEVDFEVRTKNTSVGMRVPNSEYLLLTQSRRCQDCRLVEIREVRK